MRRRTHSLGSIATLALALLLVAAAPAGAAWPYTKIVYSGGPSIDWSSDTQIFSSLPTTVDDQDALLTLPFTASFYGQSYTQVTVSTNGVLAFGNVDIQSVYTNDCPLPTAKFSGPVVMAYWDDLWLKDDPGIYGAQEGMWHSTSGTAPHREFVVHWDAETRATGERITIEVVLMEGVSGVRTYYQRFLSDPMASGTAATIGIQQGGMGGAYVQHGCNTPGLVSTATAIAYSPDPPTNTGQPQINDLTPVVGQTLTVSNGAWTAQPDGYEYRWTRCTWQPPACSLIPGATAQAYTVAQADAGKYLWAEVRAHNDFGWSAWRGAVVTGTVPNPPLPPVPANTAAPSIAGAGTVGAQLTIDPGQWTGSPTAFEYSWWRCEPDPYDPESCTTLAIPGAPNAPTYVLQQADMGGWVFAYVRAQNAGGWSTWAQTDVVDTGFWAGEPDDPDYPGGGEEGDDEGDGDVPDGGVASLAIGSLTLTPAKFRAARTGPSIARAPVGTRVAYTLSRPALLTFTFKRARPGHRVGTRCVAGRTSVSSRRCTRWVKLSGMLRYPPGRLVGSGAFRFTGRLGGKRLAAGRYRLLARASDEATRSAKVVRPFTIVR